MRMDESGGMGMDGGGKMCGYAGVQMDGGGGMGVGGWRDGKSRFIARVAGNGEWGDEAIFGITGDSGVASARLPRGTRSASQ